MSGIVGNSFFPDQNFSRFGGSPSRSCYPLDFTLPSSSSLSRDGSTRRIHEVYEPRRLPKFAYLTWGSFYAVQARRCIAIANSSITYCRARSADTLAKNSVHSPATAFAEEFRRLAAPFVEHACSMFQNLLDRGFLMLSTIPRARLLAWPFLQRESYSPLVSCLSFVTCIIFRYPVRRICFSGFYYVPGYSFLSLTL